MATRKNIVNPFTGQLQKTIDEKKLELNDAINAFRIAINGSLTLQTLDDGFVDEYQDETGIDLPTSTGELYNSTDNFYQPFQDTGLVLLTHFNGNDDATTSEDSSPSEHTLTFNGNAKLGTEDKKFGTASLDLTNTADGDFVEIPYSTDFDWGTGDFTLDLQVKVTAPPASGENILIGCSGGSQGWFLTVRESDGRIRFLSDASGGFASDLTSGSTSVADGNFHHIAIVREGANLNLYLDGTSIASRSDASSYNYSADNRDLRIGKVALSNNYHVGWIDEVRILKGDAFWTSNFTAPTEEYSSGIQDLVLVSDSQTADSVPSKARLIISEEDVEGTITLNDSLKGFVSRDDGITWSEVTLEDEGNLNANQRILSNTVSLGSQPSGTSMRYKIETINNILVKLHGAALLWD